MFKRGSKIYAILKSRCPRCHQGKVFKGSAFGDGIYNMHKECPKCQLDFEPQPGFYWGAMYVGYGIFSIFMLSMMGIMTLYFNYHLESSFVFTIVISVLLIPFFARRSRLIWMNIAMKYNKKIADQVEKSND